MTSDLDMWHSEPAPHSTDGILGQGQMTSLLAASQ